MRRLLASFCFLGLAFIACHGEQTLVDDCRKEGSNCPPCDRDDQCIIVSNPCQEHAFCTSRESSVAVTDEGCSDGYDRPPADHCRCVDHVCRQP